MAPKNSRNLVQLLVMLVSTSTSNLTGVNGAPDNMTQQQKKWKDFLRKQWIQHCKVNKFLAKLLSTRTEFKMISDTFVLFRQLVSDQ